MWRKLERSEMIDRPTTVWGDVEVCEIDGVWYARLYGEINTNPNRNTPYGAAIVAVIHRPVLAWWPSGSRPLEE